MIEATRSKLLTDKASYQSWPVIARVGATVVVAYASGAAQHQTEDDTRGVYVVRSLDDGATWSQPIPVVNSATADESTFGIGTNSVGDLLLWVRVVSGGFSNVLYASTDAGATWTLRATPTYLAQPILVGPIVSCLGVLYAPCHSGPESGVAQRSWGHLVSTDDGATWAQVILGTAATDEQWPVEPRYHVSGQRILAVARNKVDGAPLWTYTSPDGGVSWTNATATNIVDQASTPTAIVGTDDDLMIVYMDRVAGRLRARASTFDAAYADPTAWPASRVVGYGTTWPLDNGYPHAIRHGGGALVVWYSGMYRYPGIYAFTLRSDGMVKPGPICVVDRIGAGPAGILSAHPGDISFDVPVTATTPTLVAYGWTYVADEAWTWGQVYWRLLAGGMVAGAADELTISAHYYRDSGGRADPASMTLAYNAIANTVKDTGWVALPSDFGRVAAGFWSTRYRVEIRAKLKAGASGPARVYANTALQFGVAG